MAETRIPPPRGWTDPALVRFLNAVEREVVAKTPFGELIAALREADTDADTQPKQGGEG